MWRWSQFPFSLIQESCTVKGEGVAVKMELDVWMGTKSKDARDSQSSQVHAVANRGLRQGSWVLVWVYLDVFGTV